MGFGAWLRRLVPEPARPRPDGAVSRREFLAGGFLAGLARELAAPPTAAPGPAPPPARSAGAVPVLRPPGAVAEADFLAGCTRCGDCIAACPHHAIVAAPLRLRAAAGTPMIDPAAQPCLMCPDTPCITACGPRVLHREAGAPPARIGVARISSVDCLAHQGSTCSACRERCPVDGAIVLTGQRPQVAAERCTGCGICHHVCPAPRNAVLVMPPLKDRHDR